jgi:cytochrome P450
MTTGLGADSTAASIIYMFYELALPKNRKYQDKIRDEVSKLVDPLDFKSVCNLPYLNTCVLESLRLNPPGPGALQQRVTPPNESSVLSVQGKSYVLPPSTIVGVQAFSIQRKESIFGSRPDEFRPERWESADKAQLQVMKNAWIPFGSGARTCLGMK